MILETSVNIKQILQYKIIRNYIFLVKSLLFFMQFKFI